MGYVVKMALDSSFQRADSRDTRSSDPFEDDDPFSLCAVLRPGGAGISVTLWDEAPPAPEAPSAPLAPVAFDDDPSPS
ncbi:hypothetical protein QCE63_11345 [Caballeronia sp. LZ065]|uniref:hypothetical protein n=1 Tax=Caballeronia sp. LZ065 TaxID=3038571 RepID=UPI002859BE91|nr:hypothetical protein [Caballeronia sp. LZ065]MDR5780013.1 hypothetical protein [Caballeronia sp. LZ065]